MLTSTTINNERISFVIRLQYLTINKIQLPRVLLDEEKSRNEIKLRLAKENKAYFINKTLFINK